ncbi:hypothetical protein XELAEV_18000109mg [Xenopus laevis]|uniref:Uncharacterized protein n=1 Tax=Xenopus laevis TaxID=8355 RepID=A0A974BQT6_XENLA|nr:hypothetical protein XELAEV_18000109mg [Xenopus laevis]
MCHPVFRESPGYALPYRIPYLTVELGKEGLNCPALPLHLEPLCSHTPNITPINKNTLFYRPLGAFIQHLTTNTL